MKKIFFTVVFIVLVAGAVYWFEKGGNKVAPPAIKPQSDLNLKPDQKIPEKPVVSNETKEQKPTATPVPTSAMSVVSTQGSFSDGSEAEGMAPDVLVLEVNYDGNTFTPQSVEIKAGDVVIFKNSSSSDFWPASEPHPTHTEYPEFDAKQAVLPKGKFQFKFSKTGIWKYHDHLNPTVKGEIIVK